MFKQTARLFLLLVCLGTFKSFAQIAITPTAGCFPFNVTYSGPAGATNVFWNFGDGGTSNQTNPSHNYVNAGNFIVTYTANVGGSPVTYTALVISSSKPNPNFTFNAGTNGCAPRSVTFNNQSTGTGGASIVSSFWTFGDGGSSNTSNPTYGYTIPGSYSVTLKVTDSNGCDNTITVGTIHVSAPPTPVIGSAPNPLNSCVAPFTPTFNGLGSTSNSPTGGALTYSWSFGGGSPASSSQQNPGAVTYSTIGNYNVILTVTDNNNCSATANVPVTVSTPSVNVTMPGTVCIGNPLVATDQSNVGFTFWQMGNGSTYNIATSANSQTIHTYPNAGIYTITITASSGTCQAQTTKTVLVEQVTASFTNTPPSFTCSPTMTVGFINTSSSNAVSYNWVVSNYNGGSTSTSTLSNPTFTIVQGSLNPYTIFNTFNINVSLVAQSAFGCTSTITTHVYDSIRRPTAWFTKDKKEGCAPLIVNFRDSSFTSPTYPITSYTWNNGATPATTVSGTIPPPVVNPTFTYSSPGTYTPFLIVQTLGGCIDTSFVDTIHVVNPPNISFSFSPSVACWNQPVQIINTSPTLTPAIQHWHVESDNGFFSHCINDPNPSWNFTHVGTHTFALSGYHYSCKGTSSSTAAVTVNGPIVRSRYETNCTNRKTVSFVSHLQDVQNATLNFGDNTSVNIAGAPGSSVSHSVAHTYSASGNYTAVITASNAATGCAPNTFTMLVTVRDAVASFTMPAVACASVAQMFDASSSQDVSIGCKRGYVWYIDNFPPIDTTQPVLYQNFTAAGIHTVMLMVKDENSCADTMKATFRVSAASPNFTMSANPICLSSGSVTMINTTLQTPDPITSYSWNFGDGSAINTQTNPTHFYTSATIPSQSYTISLTATNSEGCTDTKTLTIQVNNPSAALSNIPSLPCVGTPVVFTAPPGYVTYTFSFGVGNPVTVNTNTVSYTYTAAGVYTSSVSIIDNGGCKSSSNNNVSVQGTPTANFSFSSANATSTNNICTGSPVTFISTSNSQHQLNYNWNLNTGSPVVNSGTVVSTYTAVGQIPISLTVTTIPNGCVSVITKTLSIFGAKANLQLDKTTICLGNAITFNVKDSSTVYAWQWDFAGGVTSPTIYASPAPSPTVSNIYTFYPASTNGSATVSITYWSSQMACAYSATQAIQILKIDADFIRNSEIQKSDSIHCLNVPDIFSNTTPGSSNYNFSWAFGDGATGSGSSANYTYPTAGVYQVTLTVTDPVNNCLGYSVKNMTIQPLPSVSIIAPDSVCQNAPFVLIGNTSPNVTTYSWSPPDGLSSPNSQSTTASSSVSPVNYSLSVTDINGCFNSTSKNVYIQLAPLNVIWDTTVIIGQQIPVNGYAGTNFSYTWTPPTHLSCTNCIYPISTATSNITYTLQIEDNLGCFKATNIFDIKVEPKATVDVPSAFTPNGDGINDIIYVDGWGIKKLNYFRIYNRWGQLLFESTDINVGWNGFFDGVPQNMETYVYQVSVDTFVDARPVLKTGSFKLIR
jgi:gliding motility-associated-like protein